MDNSNTMEMKVLLAINVPSSKYLIFFKNCYDKNKLERDSKLVSTI